MKTNDSNYIAHFLICMFCPERVIKPHKEKNHTTVLQDKIFSYHQWENIRKLVCFLLKHWILNYNGIQHLTQKQPTTVYIHFIFQMFK